MQKENQVLDWDKIMRVVRTESRVKEEEALERYHKEKSRILQRVLEQIDKETSRDPTPVPVIQYRFAASDIPEMDEIRERIGAEFQKRPIHFGLYSGRLYVHSQNSALFKFRKGEKPTSDLNGNIIKFYLIEKPSYSFSEIIQDGKVVIDFPKLGISIEEYAKVGFKIHLDESTVIEGRLSNEGESESS